MEYEELKNATDEELARRHDEQDRNAVYGTSHFLEELRHREAQRARNSIAASLDSIADNVAGISRCAHVIADYFLARWKNESHLGGRSLGAADSPPDRYSEFFSTKP